jgi:NADH-quinone oxidoreductase subunit G
MSTEIKEEIQMLNVQINGRWLQFPKGTRVIEACLEAGHFVPRYCYHPKLSSPGNCRMCLIEMGMPKMGPDRKPEVGEDGHSVINWIPRPQICCAQDISEGMAIRTDSPMAQECRKGVMEFLLINHPLDCPICDQAGECRLQEFSVDYGNGRSRFLEHKVKKPKNVEIGPRITLDDERCILCSRCIRFMKEVAKDDVLGFVDRGSYSTLTCHPDRKLDSNYSLNTVDICPVGALTSSDFRFKMRVWFLKETKSICTSCATGCNTIIGCRQNRIFRQTPRENNHVNSSWMCDYGRLNFHYIESAERLMTPLVRRNEALEASNWTSAVAHAAEAIKEVAPEDVCILASGSMTNEELWLTSKLASAIGTNLIEVIPHQGEGDDILLSAERNPNMAGAELMGVTTNCPDQQLGRVAEGVRSGQIKVLIVLGENATDAGITVEDLEKLKNVIAMNILPNDTTRLASVVLPSSAYAEKRGSMINRNGRLQRLNVAVQPPGEARDDWEILRDLIQGISGNNGLYSIEDVFRAMAEDVAVLKGLNLGKIGDLGIQLDLSN